MALDPAARAEVERLIRRALSGVAKEEQLRDSERRLKREIEERADDTTNEMWMFLMLFGATGFALFILAITSIGR